MVSDVSQKLTGVLLQRDLTGYDELNQEEIEHLHSKKL